MAAMKALFDEYGVINEASNKLPDERLKLEFLESVAELEDNECHRTRSFPKTRLHKVTGVKQAVYRGYIDKISGWRLHLMFDKNGVIHLKDIIEGQRHDDVVQVIKSRNYKYK
jgi:hypothetical protein